MRLLLTLLSALKTALLFTLEWAWWLVTLPLRPFEPPAGRSALPSPPTGAAEPAVEESTATYNSTSSKRTAAAVVNWCDGRRVHGEAAGPPPETIDDALRGWLLRLHKAQMQAIVKAGYARVSDHLCGRVHIPGVPPVTPGENRKRAEPPSAAAADCDKEPEPEISFHL